MKLVEIPQPSIRDGEFSKFLPAVAIAWSSWPAFAIREMRLEVTPLANTGLNLELWKFRRDIQFPMLDNSMPSR